MFLSFQLSPHLECLWKIGQLLWSRDFAAVHIALKQEWPKDIERFILPLKGMYICEEILGNKTQWMDKRYHNLQACKVKASSPLPTLVSTKL